MMNTYDVSLRITETMVEVDANLISIELNVNQQV